MPELKKKRGRPKGPPKASLSFRTTTAQLEQLERAARKQSIALCDLIAIIVELPGPLHTFVKTDYYVSLDVKRMVVASAKRNGLNISDYIRQKIAAYMENNE